MEKILLVFSERTIQSAVQGFTVSLNDNITNKVREKLESLTEQELIEIKGLLNKLLNLFKKLNKILLDIKNKKINLKLSWKIDFQKIRNHFQILNQILK